MCKAYIFILKCILLYLHWHALVMWRPADKSELDAFPWYLEKFMIFPIHLSLELTFSVYFLSQGLAYQLIDDVLDFTGTSASFGKGALSDIRHVTHLSLM